MEHYRKILKEPARSLRSNMTDAEQALWYRLRRKQIYGMQFYRQKPLLSFIVDFYCPTAKLVIELDGSQHFEAEHQAKDQSRDAALARLGLHVLRFDNRQVLLETDVVLPELPEGWVYAYLSDLGDLGRGKSKHRPRNDPRLFGGIYPFVQTGEIKAANRVIRQYSQTLSDFGLQQSKLWPTGTLCITIAANIAETAFLGFDGCFPDSVVGFSAFKKSIAPEYVDFFIQAARTRIEAYAPATAQKNINLETLENLVVPYCYSDEQKQILDILEKRFSIVDQLDQTLTTSLQQAEALRQSILKKAFSGQLVPQDPHDEPASALLARIRAERATVEKNTTVRPRGRKAVGE